MIQAEQLKVTKLYYLDNAADIETGINYYFDYLICSDKYSDQHKRNNKHQTRP